ncbi:MAG: shikimate kinase [Gemmatimonadetes bacterium]|nr:shikimate kinase [Gemmatimonadota bacterium]
MTDSHEIRRLVLVGFMASGKSTVGPLLARRLEWEFIDVDGEVASREGASVAEIFRTRGEAYFREAERRVAASILQRDRVVVGSGGGWGASARRLGQLPVGTVTVWLKVSAEEAVRRASSTREVRPVLEGGEPLDTARRLLKRREEEYAAAAVGVDTDGRTPEDVVEEIMETVRDMSPELAGGRNAREA